MIDAQFALVLNLHQPPGNLEDMLHRGDWMANEILWAIDRIPRALWGYEDVARVHLSVSGTLLETLADPKFQHDAYGIVDCGSLLWHLQNTRIIQILGTGYYHPVLPLIPAEIGTAAWRAGSESRGICSAGPNSAASGRRKWVFVWNSSRLCGARDIVT